MVKKILAFIFLFLLAILLLAIVYFSGPSLAPVNTKNSCDSLGLGYECSPNQFCLGNQINSLDTLCCSSPCEECKSITSCSGYGDTSKDSCLNDRCNLGCDWNGLSCESSLEAPTNLKSSIN
ncbi:MAG: hypothetical protein ACP5NS_03850 [Candidatus Pacearchaeota archaeon]